MRSGITIVLPAHGAAFFAATALATAAPGPTLPSDQAVLSPATGETALTALPSQTVAAAPASAPQETGSPAIDAVSADPEPGVVAADPAPAAEAPSPKRPARAAAEAVAGDASHVEPAASVAASSASPSVLAQSPSGAQPRTVSSPGEAPSVTEVQAPEPDACAAATIFGTDGDDMLTGTPGADFICGLGGNDTINGGGGNDRIDGGDGNDTIDGGDGDDRINGGDGDDTIDGGDGDNGINGGEGDDRIVGGDGDDRIDGGAGNDCAGGGAGSDRVAGGSDDDILGGQSGDDLIGGSGSDAGSAPLDDERAVELARATPEVRACARFLGFSPGSVIDDAVSAVGEAVDTVVDKASGLAAVESAQAAAPRPLAVFPLDRPLAFKDNSVPLRDGSVRIQVTCGGAFTTSDGELTLTIFPKRKDRRLRALGETAPFKCSPAESKPVVNVRLPIADRRLIERIGRLRVRATITVENKAGDTKRARSYFTVVPARR